MAAMAENALTPSLRVLYGRMGAHKLHAMHDSRELTAPGRRAFLSRFEREVDPAGSLPVGERARRAAHARKAYFTGLAAQSAASRAKKRTAGHAKPAAQESNGAQPPTDRRPAP